MRRLLLAAQLRLIRLVIGKRPVMMNCHLTEKLALCGAHKNAYIGNNRFGV